MDKFMKWLSSYLQTFPTTPGRIMATIFIMWMTALRYLISGLFGITAWEPSYAWLGFLGVAMGMDVAQYIGKRATYKEIPPSETEAAQ